MLKHLFVLTVLWLLIIQSLFPCLHSDNSYGSCIESERASLLAFKAGLVDPRNILSTWQGVDCCHWWGVECNNNTGHVLALNLRSANTDPDSQGGMVGNLGGEINPSLLHLKHLRRLDLSLNNFSGTPIPEFFGSFQRLRYLNLSGAGFAGQIPPHIGNLSRLRYLDLHESYPLYADNLNWLQRLSSLKHLDMTNVNLTAARDWLYMVNMLPSLSFLRLQACHLHFIPSYLPHVNFTSLDTLDLSENNFNSTFPQWLSNISSLTDLNLYWNNFYGSVPHSIGSLPTLEVLNLRRNHLDGMIPSLRNLCSLKSLDVSNNLFGGEIDEVMYKLPNCTERRLQKLKLSSNGFSGKWTTGVEQMVSLRTLDLRNNRLHGAVPVEIGKLLQLTYLDLSNNTFGGVVTEAHFANLTRLKLLILSYNSLTISLNESWLPSFQLIMIGLQSCLVGPRFPPWLQHQKEVIVLDLSSSGISDTVPRWFWKNFPPSILFLDLSNNAISGKLPESLEFTQDSQVFLSSNLFQGSLPPNLPSSTFTLDLSNNLLSGLLPNIKSRNLGMLILSNNAFSSAIPPSWSKVEKLWNLDLSNNNLSGEIPNEWPEYLWAINLGNNHLVGKIPSSLGSLLDLRSLGLRNNSLSGPFPSSLQTCIRLHYLDLGHNKLYGNIPASLAESFPFLSILILRSNMFSGIIPPQLVQLHRLRILDLAQNNLSGPIPQGLANLTSMALITEEIGRTEFLTFFVGPPLFIHNIYASAIVFTKGEELDYTKNCYLVKSIDLSNNHLRGDIPEEIGALIGMKNLDLSANHLQGKIPEKIGNLKELESLDLSRNQLSGNIPLSISSLNSLAHLNVSYNHLSGQIPTGNQMQTLTDPSIYAGNTDLCGFPLPKNCSSNKTSISDAAVAGDENTWFYVGLGMGYVAAFWTVCGVLLFKKEWRYAYFRFFDNWYDRIYVAVSLSLAKFKRQRMGGN